MRTNHYYDSCGAGQIHFCKWMPEGTVKGIVQIVHGIAERVTRYDHFANYLTGLGYVVVAEDHMGHGGSIGQNGIQGYFHGGWFAAVEDTYRLLKNTMEEYPGVPYVLLGHSMGSFMARTILAKYPHSGITAAVISGTAWQPALALPLMIKILNFVCKKTGETVPNEQMDRLIFGGYNSRIENPRTTKDWLTRDEDVVDAYVEDPLCGFVASSGLLRDMMTGIHYIEQKENLYKMRTHLPVLFIAGEEDPVGNYGSGVRQTAEEFKRAGMVNVALKLYPGCRHEILNELNKEEVYADVANWLEPYVMGE